MFKSGSKRGVKKMVEMFLREIAEEWDNETHFMLEGLEVINSAIALSPTDKSLYTLKLNVLKVVGSDNQIFETYDMLRRCGTKHSKDWSQGISLRYLGKHAEAIEFFEKAIAKNFKDVNAYYAKGLSLMDLGRYDEALVALDFSLGLCEAHNTLSAHFFKGCILQFLGRPIKAAAAYKVCEGVNDGTRPTLTCILSNKINSLSGEYLDSTIDSLYGAGLDPSTLDIVKTAMNYGVIEEFLSSHAPSGWTYDTKEIMARVGSNLRRMKGIYIEQTGVSDTREEDESTNNGAEVPTAIQMNDAAEIASPQSHRDVLHQLVNYKGDALVHFLRGCELKDLKRYEEAIDSFDKALALDSKSTKSHLFKALVLYDLTRYEEAIASFDNAIDLDPKKFISFQYKGIALYQLGRYDEAIASFDEAIALKPLDILMLRKGLSLHKLGRYEEAINSFDKAIKLDPKYVTAHCHKAYALLKLDQYDKSIDSCEAALHINPNIVFSYCIKAQALIKLGKNEEALECIDQAKALVSSGKADTSFDEGPEGKEFVQEMLSKEKGELIKVVSEIVQTEVESVEAVIAKEFPQHVKAVALSRPKSIAISKTLDDSKKDLVEISLHSIKSKVVKVPYVAASDKWKKLTIEHNKIVERDVAKLRVVFQELGSESVIDAEEDTDEKASLIREIEENKAEINQLRIEQQRDREMMRELASRLKEMDAEKASKAEVSYAIKVNDAEELKASQMQEINSDPRLKEYYDGFVYTFSETFATSQIVLSGKFETKGSIGPKIFSLAPLCGSVIGEGLKILTDHIKGAGYSRHAAKFKEMARNHSSLDELVEHVAREVTLHPSRKQLLLAEEQAAAVTSSWIAAFTSHCSKFGVKLRVKLYGEKYKTDSAKLGYKDAATLIAGWVEGKIIQDEGELLSTSLENYLLRGAKVGSKGEVINHSECSVMYLTKVTYDNPELVESLSGSGPVFIQGEVGDLFDSCAATH